MKKSPKGAGTARTMREVSAGGLIWRRTGGGGVEVVLIKPKGKDSWALPKGQVEKGETFEQTAVRECREETGLEVQPGEKLGEISYVYSRREADLMLTRIFKRVTFFLMDYKSGDPRPQASEIAEVIWVPMEQAFAMASYPTERKLIAKARDALA
jgi:8-oxo-dGTP pyrophosphatase MutT (NUDIX family)